MPGLFSFFLVKNRKYFRKNQKQKKPVETGLNQIPQAFSKKNPGNVRLSHEVALEVSWALKGLTTVFGTGTGVAPSL